MVSTSVVAFDVRPGNPKGIADFDDLAQPGVEVLTPDPAQSGGARWNIVGAYGASLNGYAGGKQDDEAAAGELLKGIFSNVTVLDKSARDSIKNFETGNGDVAITYENEILTAQKAGLEDEMVIPPSTVLIENPVAVVDENVDEHCVRDVAEAFVDYLHTQEAKDLYTTVGFLRSTDATEAAKGSDEFPAIKALFTVDDLGGWDTLGDKVFGEPDGIFTKAFAEAQG
jgi:sulfate transport system substrate-binding protein